MASVISHTIVKSPAACSDAEIADFVSFVSAGGEVTLHGLEERIRSAERIVFLLESGCLLGTAGLKNPSNNHRNEVASLSHVPLSTQEFPFELGWVFILPSARGRHLSLPLCQPLVEFAADQGIFATSKTANVSMHRTLSKLGFFPAGAAYQSSFGNYQLQVFLRHAA